MLNALDGVVLFDKPMGVTSHDVVAWVRKKLGGTKVGHAGTLDPMATGLLVLALGKGTKLASKLTGHIKHYEGEICLGSETNTGDREGKITRQMPIPTFTELQIQKTMETFLGDIQQIPPMTSALHYQGKRLYQLARSGIEVPRNPRPITIYDFKLIKFCSPIIYFKVICSKGTYVRTLCSDLANRLDTVGHLNALRRLQSGPFLVKDAITMDHLNTSQKFPENCVLPISEILSIIQ